jgi:hypothetical protein
MACDVLPDVEIWIEYSPGASPAFAFRVPGTTAPPLIILTVVIAGPFDGRASPAAAPTHPGGRCRHR